MSELDQKPAQNHEVQKSNSRRWLVPVLSALIVLFVGFVAYLLLDLNEKKRQAEKMTELVEMDKREMENEYEQFAMQYNEMKMKINNDSLIAQLEQEQQRSENLLAELRRVKSTDAAEILRLKKELATLREVLRSYVLQIDSLNRQNAALTQENTSLKTQNQQAQQHISSLNTQNEELNTKVEIASQLNATNVRIEARNRRGREAKKIADVRKFAISFQIQRNVTTSTGIRSIYVRIATPTGQILGRGNTFSYENRQLAYSIKKDIEYTGEEQTVSVWWDVNETLSAGTYRVDIFSDGYNIGTGTYTCEK